MRFLFPLALLFALALPVAAQAAGGTLTYTVEPNVLEHSKTARVWLPYPLSGDDQTVSQVKVEGNYATSGVYADPASRAVYLFADWPTLTEKPRLSLSFHVDSNFKKGAPLTESKEPIPADIKSRYLASTEWIPADCYKAEAAKAVKGKTGVLAKAKAIYDWTVSHTFRDPNVKGCGLGIPGRTLTDMQGGGKCADISTVFVTMARAAGIPARDVFGIRLAAPKTGEVTGDFHCWAEFYLPGHGWVMVDPADVRKMMLVNNLELGDPRTKQWSDFFWNGDDLFRVTLAKEARGVRFNPPQAGPELNYFMYPFGQVDGESLNYFDPASFRFKVSFTAD